MLTEIYYNIFQDSSAGKELDRKVTSEVEKEYMRRSSIKATGFSEKEWKNMLTYAMDAGQSMGFEAGVQFALRFIFRNLMR